MNHDSQPNLEDVLDDAETALDRGDAETALQLCDEVLAQDPEHPGAWYLTAEAFRDLGDLDEAESRYRRVTQLSSEYSPGWSGLASTLLDGLRWEESRAAALRAVRVDPENPEAYWVRGMLRERRGDFRGANRDFRRAYRLDPDHWDLPVELDDGTVEAVVTEAVNDLHPTIQTYLANVSILLEEVPSEEVLRQFDPPAPPGEILGFFSGSTVAAAGSSDPWSQIPATITLFRRNLQRMASNREHLLEELRVTVFHEVGHFLGLDEDDLEQRGLD